MGESFVVDNSVVMAWCFKNEADRFSDAVLERLADASALVPSIWPLEVVNVLLVAERRKIIGRADAVRFMELLMQLPIHVEHEMPVILMKDIHRLGGEFGLSGYDASYLSLALKKGLPLATKDKKLKKAASELKLPLL